MLAFFLQGAVLGFAPAVSPGAFQGYLLAQTVQNGLRRTLPSAFAPLLGTIYARTLSLRVLSALRDSTKANVWGDGQCLSV